MLSGLLALAATSLHAVPVLKRIGFDDLKRMHATTDPDTGTAGEIDIELTGYMLPADQEGDLVYEFMLVARAGACSHAAPPPANQVVRVIPDKPFAATRVYQPVRVTGTLKPEYNKSQLYVLDGVLIVESGFRIGSAVVTGADSGPASLPRGTNSPWRFLEN